MGIKKEQVFAGHSPIGMLKAKYQSTLYLKNGDELVRTNEYVKMGEVLEVYSIDNEIADIGYGYFVKEVDTNHFDITYGALKVLSDDVFACSKNGFRIRRLLKGCEYNVVGFEDISDDVTIYRINSKEYLSSCEDIEFISCDFIARKNN
jgi:hypothetical protein